MKKTMQSMFAIVSILGTATLMMGAANPGASNTSASAENTGATELANWASCCAKCGGEWLPGPQACPGSDGECFAKCTGMMDVGSDDAEELCSRECRQSAMDACCAKTTGNIDCKVGGKLSASAIGTCSRESDAACGCR